MSRHRYAQIICFFVVLAFISIVLPSPTRAQISSSRILRFEIRAGALAGALSAFETLTGIRVAPPESATVQGLSSPGVSATCTVERALEQLLVGTGLTFRVAGANAYALEILPLSETVEVRARIPYQPEVTSTATRTPTLLRDVPQAVTVISQPMMADQMMVGMADVMRYVPGAGMAQGEGNRDTPILRGTSTTGDFFVDGIRDDVQYYRDLYNVDTVEALKGPNAMIFGRGGAGGVINRTTRQADWGTARELALQGGSHDNRRATIDWDHPLTAAAAARVNGMYENSGSYRHRVTLERYGLNPTLAFRLHASTTIRLGYERFHDERTADRGIPSSGARPLLTDPSTFFGDPELSHARVTVNAFTAGLDRTFSGGALVRSRTRYAEYDKFYQNVYASSAVAAHGSTASLSAYNNATARQNLFNQTDLAFRARTGRLKHVLLAGAELGRQVTDNFRNTGYFTSLGPAVTSMPVVVSSPTVSVPVTFRQSATDADNHGIATVVALFAQDQVQLSRKIQAVGGIRYDRFQVDLRNHRTAQQFSSRDDLISPRLGFIYTPGRALSIYTSYSLAYVPRAGDQLSSLSVTSQALEPEKFTNYEVGAKWDVRSGLALTTAVYRLDRTNVVIPDPTDPTRSLLVDGQRTRGVEVGLAGNITPSWRALGAYAYQDGTITRTLSPNAPAGAVLAQLPAHSFSLWNRYDFARALGIGVGVVHNSDRFTSTDNTVVLPAFTRIDGALFVALTRHVRAQVNVENLLDERYYAYSNGNNNITPGAPRAVRVSLTTRF